MFLWPTPVLVSIGSISICCMIFSLVLCFSLSSLSRCASLPDHMGPSSFAHYDVYWGSRESRTFLYETTEDVVVSHDPPTISIVQEKTVLDTWESSSRHTSSNVHNAHMCVPQTWWRGRRWRWWRVRVTKTVLLPQQVKDLTKCSYSMLRANDEQAQRTPFLVSKYSNVNTLLVKMVPTVQLSNVLSVGIGSETVHSMSSPPNLLVLVFPTEKGNFLMYLSKTSWGMPRHSDPLSSCNALDRCHLHLDAVFGVVSSCVWLRTCSSFICRRELDLRTELKTRINHLFIRDEFWYVGTWQNLNNSTHFATLHI